MSYGEGPAFEIAGDVVEGVWDYHVCGVALLWRGVEVNFSVILEMGNTKGKIFKIYSIYDLSTPPDPAALTTLADAFSCSMVGCDRGSEEGLIDAIWDPGVDQSTAKIANIVGKPGFISREWGGSYRKQ